MRRGAAIHLDRDRDLPGIVDSLFANPSLLTMMGERARTFGRPSAARDIAVAVLGTIPPAREGNEA